MKYKLLILIIISSLIVFLIYNKYYEKSLNITSINTLNKDENYNYAISDTLLKSKYNYKLNIDYTNDNMEIENLHSLIENNYKKIQSIIHDSDVLLLSIGNIDYMTEDIKVISEELNNLFKLIRSIDSKIIIYVSPPEFNKTEIIKQLCHKYNIIFVNGRSFKDRTNQLSQMIVKIIDSKYNKEKY